MKTIGKVISLSVLVIILASCNSFSPKPTEPSTKTSPLISTNTPVPMVETTSTPVLLMPSGKPASEWEGIPVMPNAIAGDGDSKGYSFTINATPDEIQKFYEKELGKLGWNTFANGQGTKEAVLLIFMNDTTMLTVSIISQPDGIMYVLLVK